MMNARRIFPLPGILLCVVVFIGTLAVGALFSWRTAVWADCAMRREVLTQARLVAQMISVASIKTLTGTQADLSNVNYQWFKKKFACVKAARNECRFVYLMGRKANGRIFFFVDNEPENSPDYSPPGQELPEASEEYRRLFDTKQALAEGPVTDRWGTWVSALVPIIDQQTGELVAMFGLDFDARDWRWNVAAKMALPVGLMLIMLIGIVAACAIIHSTDVSPKPALRRLLPPLFAMLILIVAGVWMLLWWQERMRLSRELDSNIRAATREFQLTLNNHTINLMAILPLIVANVEMQEALRKGDADHLLGMWRSIFEKLCAEQDITHFYFSDARRNCLLRVHQPELRGGKIERVTALEAERTGKAASSIELGRRGTLALRVVQPVFAAGTLIGYVELGQDISFLARSMQFWSGDQLAVVIPKKHLIRQTWEDGMRRLGREADWDRLSNSVVSFSSQGHLSGADASWIDHAVDEHVCHEMSWDAKSDNNDLQIVVIPLSDVSGKKIGDILMAHNITAKNAASARLLCLSGMIGLVFLVLVLSLVVVLLRRTDKGILAQQAKLRESERRYRTFINGTSDLVFLKDESFRYLISNEANSAFLGQPEAAVIGRTDFDLMPGYAAEHCRASDRDALAKGGGVTTEEVVGSKTYQVDKFPVSLSGGVVGVGGYIRDITERKRVEEALRESETKYRRLSDDMPVFIVTFLPCGTLTYVNKSLAAAQTLTPSELVGRNFFDFLSDDDRKMVRERIALLTPEHPLETHEQCYQRPGGGMVYHQWTNRAFFDAAGRPTSFQAVGLDITVRKLVEIQRELLVRADKMATLGTLVAGVAHEINNPNNFITISIPVLRDAWRSVEPIIEAYFRQHGDFLVGGVNYSEMKEDIKALFDGIEDGARRIGCIVSDFRSYVRGDNEQDVLRDVDINAVVRNAVGLLSGDIKKYTRYFSVTYGRDIPGIQGRQKRLDQVVVNLVQNAYQALVDPEKAVTIRTLYDAAGDVVEVIIRDEGVGMDQHTKSHVADPFFTTKRDHGGTGLGLFVSTGIVHEHEGAISFESAPGKGTTVVLRLPVRRTRKVGP